MTSDVSGDGAPLLLAGARLLDPAGDRWIDGAVVHLEGGRIRGIGPEPRVAPSASTARRLDLAGRFVVPGLIDLHTHLLLQHYTRISWENQVLHDSLERRTVHAVAAARASLLAGFTTLRDLGTESAGLADVALRDAIAEGTVPGPRLFVATRAIVASGCYGPYGIDPRWRVPPAAQAADGRDGVRRAVREQAAAGADWIKVYADGRRGRGAPVTPSFSQEEMDALVDEAHSAGRPIAAHATTDEGIRRAVLAGVTTIEHAYEATDASLAMMAAKGVALCPTLATAEAIAVGGGWNPAEPEPARLRAARNAFARARALGVTIACGSDAGVFAHGDNAREIELMAACGMTPAEALRAATATAARVLGRGAAGDGALPPLGVLAEGGAADLIALAEDPLRDPAALRRPVLVIKDGLITPES